jgi:DNA-binding IclR family transcriptional regulator
VALGGETSQTLDRGITVLHLVAASGEAGLSVTEIATQLGVGRPVVYRLLATLTEHDLVRRFGDGQVRLGLGLLPLAAATHDSLRVAATPILRRLAEDTGATAHLTIADLDEAIAVAVEVPRTTPVHVAYRVGSRHSLEAGAAGRAIAAGRAGRRGTVETHDELQAGARGVAVPILGVDGLDASIGVVTVGHLGSDVAVRVRAAARELMANLSLPQ